MEAISATDTSVGRYPVIAKGARTLFRRRRLDALIDGVRFRIDSFPRSPAIARLAGVTYPPLPWVGLTDAPRSPTSESRWNAIEPVLRRAEVGSGVDIGCNWGFFTMSMASAGIPTVGIDNDPPAVRTALYAATKAGFDHVGICSMQVSPATIGLVPEADAVLLLALWHHFVKTYGFETATAMLETIWGRSRKVLFFDTGEGEMPASFGLPKMDPTPREWLTAYLGETCAGGTVEHLGTHPAFAPDRTVCQRNLFAVVR